MSPFIWPFARMCTIFQHHGKNGVFGVLKWSCIRLLYSIYQSPSQNRVFYLVHILYYSWIMPTWKQCWFCPAIILAEYESCSGSIASGMFTVFSCTESRRNVVFVWHASSARYKTFINHNIIPIIRDQTVHYFMTARYVALFLCIYFVNVLQLQLVCVVLRMLSWTYQLHVKSVLCQNFINRTLAALPKHLRQISILLTAFYLSTWSYVP
jgi:hypothetical protein